MLLTTAQIFFHSMFMTLETHSHHTFIHTMTSWLLISVRWYQIPKANTRILSIWCSPLLLRFSQRPYISSNTYFKHVLSDRSMHFSVTWIVPILLSLQSQKISKISWNKLNFSWVLHHMDWQQHHTMNVFTQVWHTLSSDAISKSIPFKLGELFNKRQLRISKISLYSLFQPGYCTM